jgi:hypothetical protein
VALADRSPREVRLGDCELVEQFRDKVLPMFTTRNVENRMTCVPNQLSGSVINLTFEVFAGLAPYRAGNAPISARCQRPVRSETGALNHRQHDTSMLHLD